MIIAGIFLSIVIVNSLMQQLKIDWGKVPSVMEIVGWVRRALGEPIVKCEVTDQQIIDNIHDAFKWFLYWASISYEEQYYALTLQGGVSEYNLGDGILDVLDFNEYSVYSAGINTLFTLPNQMQMAGMFDFSMQGENTMLLLNYHLVLDFMETLQRYASSKYQFSFDPMEKVLTLDPAPEHQLRTITDSDGKTIQVDSPGWVLLKVKQFIGAGRPGWNLNNALRKLLSEIWIRKYALALTKRVLGLIRRKYGNFQSIGNTGIALDGDSLVTEGTQEIEELEKQLTESGLYDNTSYGILMAPL